MIIYHEMELRQFEPWAGAVSTYEALTYEQLDELEAILEDAYPDGMREVDVNDLLWFESDLVAEWLGFDDFEALCDANEAA